MRRIPMMLLVVLGAMTEIAATALAQSSSGTDREALALAVRGAWLPLESGMTVSRSEGTPISAKYEIDDDTFQLSVYTTSGDRVSEVIVDESVGTVAKVDVITDGEDLAAAHRQREAMARATRTLEVATTAAVRANPGYRAVSALPQMADGHPVVEITLVNGTEWRVVHERLD